MHGVYLDWVQVLGDPRAQVPGLWMGTLQEASDALNTVAKLARHWIASESGGDFVSVWSDEELQGADEGAWPKSPDVTQAAWRLFVRELNKGTAFASVHLDLDGDIGHFDRARGLVTALCIQLHNLVVERVPPKFCGNETCGQAFVHQEGRAEYGQHRSKGVLYCSKSCARAQANRQYRRRRKVER